MRVADFERVVCITVDTRFPEWPARARAEVERVGGRFSLFLNGSSRVEEIGRDDYGMVHGPVPSSFTDHGGAYHLAMAFREVVQGAKDDGLDRVLIVEDDVEFTDAYDGVVGKVRVPDDWGLYYFGANHNFHPTDEAGPNLLRLHGSYTTHCVAVHRRAFDAILSLPVDGPIDVMLGAVHEALPCYAVWPSVAVQRPGISSIHAGQHADYTAWFAARGKNWPMPGVVARPDVARQVRLSILRNACPDASQAPGCGCRDTKLCARDGREKTRDECYRCLDASPDHVEVIPGDGINRPVAILEPQTAPG